MSAIHINGSSKSTKKSMPKTGNVSSEQVVLDQEESLASKMRRMVEEQYEALGIAVPDWKRKAVAYVGAFLIGYGFGSLFAYLDVIFLSSLATTSVFLYWLAYVLGLVLTIYAAIKVSQKWGGYVISGDIDADLTRAKNWVSGFFNSKKVAAA